MDTFIRSGYASTSFTTVTSYTGISAVITFHREGPLAYKTLLGMERLRQHAEQRGIEVEFVAVLDRTDKLTSELIRTSPVLRADDLVLDVENGDAGASRNSGISASRKEFIGVFDGDDFCSDNWLTEAFAVASAAPTTRIVHPELTVSFGETHCVMRLLDMEEYPNYPLQNCVAVHPWIACAFAHRSIFEKFPYGRCDTTETGFGYEDWHWNLETIAAGASHVTARHTAHFYRRKPSSALTHHVGARAVIRPTKFFDRPDRWQLLVRSQTAPQALPGPGLGGGDLIPAWVLSELRVLATIEPQLEPTPQFLSYFIPYRPPYDLAPGELYHKAHAQGGGTEAGLVCLAPWLDWDDPLQEAWRRSMTKLSAGRRVLVISTEPGDSRRNRAVPAEFQLLEFGQLAQGFVEEVQAQVLGRLLLQSSASDVLLLQSNLGGKVFRDIGRSLAAVGKRMHACVGEPEQEGALSEDITAVVREATKGNAAARARLAQLQWADRDVLHAPVSAGAQRGFFSRVLQSARRTLRGHRQAS